MIRTFEVIRQEDETGISGTGVVVEGTIFSDGTCVTRWVSPTSTGRSTNIWDSFGAFSSIHISPHPDNKTKVIFNDGTEYLNNEKVEEPVKPKRSRRKKEAVANGKG